MLRIAGLLLVLAGNVPASAAPKQLPDCPQKFLAQWLWDREAALKNMPQRECRLYGETNQFVCGPKGCIARR